MKASICSAIIAIVATSAGVSAFSPTVTGLSKQNLIGTASVDVASTSNAFRTTLNPNHRSTSLQASASENEGFFSDLEINAPYAIAYFSFLAFAAFASFSEAPGASQAILDKFLADPIQPGVNELFASVFNLLGLVVLPMACLIMPSAKSQKLNPGPFVAGGAFGGYGAVRQ